MYRITKYYINLIYLKMLEKKFQMNGTTKMKEKTEFFLYHFSFVMHIYFMQIFR